MGLSVAKNQPAATSSPIPQGPSRAERLQQCAQRLEEAIAIRVSHHDTDSKVARINEQRLAVMAEVARELRALA
jgi:hypothetical protein